MADLEGRSALVTGAGIRVGRAIALHLAKRGCDLIIHYNTSTKEAASVADEVETLGRKAQLLQADLRDPDAPERMAKAVRSSWGRLDILINNASSYPDAHLREARRHFMEETVESWEESFAVNARAPYFLIQALIPLLRQSPDANVINILDSSISKFFFSRVAHSLSKGVLQQITETAAEEFSGSIRINALELGKILPGQGRSAEEAAKDNWIGVAPVLSALDQILDGGAKVTGQIIRVSDR